MQNISYLYQNSIKKGAKDIQRGIMFTAKTENGGIVHISGIPDNSSEKYYCPGCERELVIKHSRYGTPYFSHRAYSVCSYSESDKQWRDEWLKRAKPEERNQPITHTFPYESEYMRKIGFKKNKEYRFFADIKKDGFIIMLMADVLSRREFLRINYFFFGAGYRVVWIMNLSRFCRDGNIGISKESEKDGSFSTFYRLSSKITTFNGSYIPSKKLSVYFEMSHGLWEKYSSRWERDRIYERIDEPFFTKMIWAKKDNEGRVQSMDRFCGVDADITDILTGKGQQKP